jgi:hypothetical protein
MRKVPILLNFEAIVLFFVYKMGDWRWEKSREDGRENSKTSKIRHPAKDA